MQREDASEEARIVGRSRCGAVYTWGYERAFENGLDSNWAAQGWRGISFGLISPMGECVCTCFTSATQHLDSARILGHLARMLAVELFVRMAARRRVLGPREVCFAAGSVAA